MALQASVKHRIHARMARTGERYAAHSLARPAQNAPSPRTRVWQSEPDCSDDLLRKSTGRGWDAWCDLIDAWPGHDRGHSAIAAYLLVERGVDGWWAQTITVGYERITGRRLPYQMADGSFTASRSRTVALSARALRDWLLDAESRADLFPGHRTELLSKPGTKAIRLSIGPGRATFSIEPATHHRAKVTVAHERLPSAELADQWRFYWSEWLDAIDA